MDSYADRDLRQCGNALDRQHAIDAAVNSLVRSLPDDDQELRDYAEAARYGNVQ